VLLPTADLAGKQVTREDTTKQESDDARPEQHPTANTQEKAVQHGEEVTPPIESSLTWRKR
jgi:hypothetical protein